ncbi:MAG: energy transducer TonB [Steroidobacteraceae bacterium]
MALTAAAESESKRGTILIIVIAIHAVGLWIVESGLSKSIVEMVTGPVETKMIEDVKPPDDTPPPPPPPDIAPPPPFIPPPEVMVQVQAQTNAIQTVTNVKPPVVAPPVMAPPPKPVIPGTSPKVSRRARSPDEYYPAAANRDNETGSVIIQCYVDLNGRCTQTTVDTSSGFTRLDEAAVKYANEGIRFDPGTTEGKPAAMWYKFRVTFKQTR